MQRNRTSILLVVAMLGAVAAAAALASWDDRRESAAALEDFAQVQSTLAATVATELSTRLLLARRDLLAAAGGAPLPEGFLSLRIGDDVAPAGGSAAAPAPGIALAFELPDGRRAVARASAAHLLGGLGHLERPNEAALLLQEPGASALRSADGRRVQAPALERGLSGGAATVRLPGLEAAPLGLPMRTAVAGLAHTDGGVLGRWGVAVVASAVRERDRERRASWRLLLAVLVASGLVTAFGGFALREQRRELTLAQSLASAQAARESDARLQRLERAATVLTMASGVAHEIATPLGVIVGRAEQLRARAGDDTRAARSAQAILDQAENIHQVARGFLELARGGEPQLQQVRPAEVVSAAMRLVEHRFALAGVQLEVRVPDGLPALRCAPRLLEHALVNLLLNACDACPRGGLVEISAERAATGIRFVVDDDGPGITLEDAARATEPFFTTKPAGKGSGLGLAIANEIAKTHHGSMDIRPRPTRGTRACVQIPLGAADA